GATNGLLTWTPTRSQTPSTNAVTVVVTDNGTPALTDTKSIVITVVSVNNAPQLAAISNQIAQVLETLVLTNSATDTDAPAQTLTYSLDPGAPAGATIRATNGVFTWTPSRAQAHSTNTITVRVTDNGYPPLSDAKTFKVI